MDLFLVTDSVEEAVGHIVEAHRVMSDKRLAEPETRDQYTPVSEVMDKRC